MLVKIIFIKRMSCTCKYKSSMYNTVSFGVLQGSVHGLKTFLLDKGYIQGTWLCCCGLRLPREFYSVQSTFQFLRTTRKKKRTHKGGVTEGGCSEGTVKHLSKLRNLVIPMGSRFQPVIDAKDFHISLFAYISNIVKCHISVKLL